LLATAIQVIGKRLAGAVGAGRGTRFHAQAATAEPLLL
jgi:hypothetical protein